MFVEDDEDSEENSVSLTAGNTIATGDLMDFPAIPAAAPTTEGFEDLAALFREHYKGIYRVSCRVTGSQSDAEDVLQTIFLRLSSNSPTTAITPNPRAYLYRAAINASLDLIRQRKRTNSVPLDLLGVDQTPRAAFGNPEEDLVDIELRELLRQAVAQLEGRAATAFVLRYYEGYDNGRIAEILGTSSMVVAVTLHRARTRLRKEIGNYLEKHHEAQ
ncbi:MAG: sigma-70 family RNA polymerase sigma factor [bacterium]|nr:sigma-70 family RNA polymerase sigma factor [bacterium]